MAVAEAEPGSQTLRRARNTRNNEIRIGRNANRRRFGEAGCQPPRVPADGRTAVCQVNLQANPPLLFFVTVKTSWVMVTELKAAGGRLLLR